MDPGGMGGTDWTASGNFPFETPLQIDKNL
jgi:hypothetical protein